ncbi:unnamed protein product [Arabis nemorensis]|uniref:Uncharacterized protein n=1 Tax=Arabis nemorensis TaxID=586526 RepID=A0A565BSQ5_9BRAS|nr:unnamed protein product [Arabis nemorensis]
MVLQWPSTDKDLPSEEVAQIDDVPNWMTPIDDPNWMIYCQVTGKKQDGSSWSSTKENVDLIQDGEVLYYE